MNKLIVLLAIFCLWGCTNIKVTPPDQQHIIQNQQYNKSYEQVWLGVIDWVVEHNISIEEIEKSSGLLTAKYLVDENDSYLDCGKVTVKGILGHPYMEKYSFLFITVRAQKNNQTSVRINLFGNYKITVQDVLDKRIATSSGHCISTGKLEENILGYISQIE